MKIKIITLNLFLLLGILVKAQNQYSVNKNSNPVMDGGFIVKIKPS